MWCEAGFPPDSFWHQTERSFSNALAGVAKRRITEAWQVAAMSAAASVGKLKDLREYLPGDVDEKRTPGSSWVLSQLFKMKAKGVPMKIERVH